MGKRAKVIAVVNQKGGTGKTTTCENLGVGLAKEGKKVLLVDVDPQDSLTIALGNQQPDELSVTLSEMMAKVLQEQEFPPGEGILHHEEGIDLMPSNIQTSVIPHSVSLGGAIDVLALSEAPQANLTPNVPGSACRHEVRKIRDCVGNARKFIWNTFAIVTSSGGAC